MVVLFVCFGKVFVCVNWLIKMVILSLENVGIIDVMKLDEFKVKVVLLVLEKIGKDLYC